MRTSTKRYQTHAQIVLPSFNVGELINLYTNLPFHVQKKNQNQNSQH